MDKGLDLLFRNTFFYLNTPRKQFDAFWVTNHNTVHHRSVHRLEQ